MVVAVQAVAADVSEDDLSSTMSLPFIGRAKSLREFQVEFMDAVPRGRWSAGDGAFEHVQEHTVKAFVGHVPVPVVERITKEC